ncbi:ATP-binding protein [Calothrix sp. PCC 7507]|uniref:sensor histidine kinase n=1 Tax=Calothrix sp. PCC 7507 TaxID=99598 RepID=UPI00029EFD2C|nr:ATP-binding protein [Calothrix sp. PCC 7507]AFY31482.1 integral membrane sensor signal transduction histidine kinase [Calothrix sp. PCC 7507]
MKLVKKLSILDWGKHLIANLSVAKKIGYGYGLAISIAILGTGIGLIVGDFSQRKAQEQIRIADAQNSLINELTVMTLLVRSHPQQLLATLTDSIWFRYETGKFTNDVNRVKDLLAQLQVSTSNNSTQSAIESQQIQQLVQDYRATTEAYIQFTTSLWRRIDPQNLNPAQITQSPQKVLAALTEAEAIQIRIKFERLSEDLIRFKQASFKQRNQALFQLDQARNFRSRIIIISIVISTAIAITLAVITSRNIAQPIHNLTYLAKRSLKESNFDLQADIISNDEIGSLASSFNQLISSVKHLLQEQQQAQEVLEQKVVERTQELSEKNTYLKDLLEELHRTQAQMVQSEKMSSLGQLVAGVAHEINNPVNFIHGNLEYVDNYTRDLLKLVENYQQYYPEPLQPLQDLLDELDLNFLTEDLQKILQSMRIGTTRIREIVLSLRNFSRLDEAEFKMVDIHEGLNNTLLILQHRLEANNHRPEIQVVQNYGQLPMIECYPGQLNQVFMNLLGNAIDALETSNQGRSSDEISANPNIISIFTQMMDENWISIAIADNGCGIPEEIHSRLFDPFFTTKPIGKGTGLGLSISYQIVVEKHAGKIHCDSTPQQGTKFVLQIPVRQISLKAA